MYTKRGAQLGTGYVCSLLISSGLKTRGRLGWEAQFDGLSWDSLISGLGTTQEEGELRWLWCRVVHRILTTNACLLGLKYVENDLCLLPDSW